MGDKNAYLEQLKFANKKTLEIVDKIQERNAENVIIIVSDHGYRYYINYEKIIKPKKYYYARWKQRPGIEEKKFGDNLNFFKKLKNNFFFRF